MLVLRYVPLHLSLSLILGILAGFYWKHIQGPHPALFMTLLLLIGLGHYLQQRSYRFQPLFLVSVHLFTAFSGMYLIRRDLAGGAPNHYSNHYKEGDIYRLKLKRELKGNRTWRRFEAMVIMVGETHTKGKLYVSLAPSSLSKSLQGNDLISSIEALRDIYWSGNPGSFDFRSYAEKRGIRHQVYLEKDSYVYEGKARPSLYSRASSWNRKCSDQLDALGLSVESRSLLKALVLGDKTEIPDELSADFRSAGAAHVLALSGLHVGILIGLIRILLLPLRRFHLAWMNSLIELNLLWTFAFFTGLSASVVRAVGMYSCYLIGKRMSKGMPEGSVIVMALFFMLLFHPLFLFDLGFQLSFTAVAGITILFPKFKNLGLPKRRPLRYPVELVYVSASAQFGVLPLILLYFHSFSGHFMISALAIVPLLGLLIPYGIAVLVCSFLFPVPDMMVQALELFLGLVHDLVGWISQFEILQWQHIYFTKDLAITLYGLLLVLFWMIGNPGRKLFYSFLALILLFEIQLVRKRYQHRNSEEILVAQLRGRSLITYRQGDRLYHFNWSAENKGNNPEALEEYLGTMPCHTLIQPMQQTEVIYSNNNLLRLVGRDHLVLEDEAESGIVVLHDSPRIHLEKLIRCYKPEIIVSDGSNYPSMVRRWQKTCEKYGVRFYDTRKQGAFVYRSG